MSEKHSVSRRASLKGLGAMGTVLVLGGVRVAARQAEPKSAGRVQDKQAGNVVDVAAGRFTKGHS